MEVGCSSFKLICNRWFKKSKFHSDGNFSFQAVIFSLKFIFPCFHHFWRFCFPFHITKKAYSKFLTLKALCPSQCSARISKRFVWCESLKFRVGSRLLDILKCGISMRCSAEPKRTSELINWCIERKCALLFWEYFSVRVTWMTVDDGGLKNHLI